MTSSLTIALLLGAGFGFGVWAVIRGLRPPRPSLAESLAALRRTPAPAPLLLPREPGWAARLGRPAVAVLTGFGVPTASVRRDLAVLERPVEQHVAEKATAALVGLLLPAVVTGLLALSGRDVSLLAPMWGALLLGAAGFVVPDLAVKAEAANRRRDFRHALSAYLDLVVISLAGGSGVDGALTDAATVGRGWAFTQIRRALQTARLTRAEPFSTLGRLGGELGVDELVELSASVSLAGSEGAKVRASLAAKAQALRTHQLTEAEADAHAATERMSLPVVLLFAAFLIFLGYPAAANVLGGI